MQTVQGNPVFNSSCLGVGHAAWDYSAWVRTYALFLEERLECFRVLKYDVESERATVSPVIPLFDIKGSGCQDVSDCQYLMCRLKRAQVFNMF